MVDANGRVSAVSAGETLITATRGAVADTVIVTVLGGAVAPARVLIEPRVATVVPGKTLQLAAVVIDESGTPIPGLTVEWSSVDPGIASLSGAGLVHGSELGRARIVVALGALRDTAWVRVGAIAPAGRVQVEPHADTLASATEDVRLFAQVRDTAGSVVPGAAVRWTSLDPAIASVTADGTVVPVAGGTARIVGTYGVSADTADVLVADWQFPTGVKIEPRTATITQVGGSLDLEAIITDQTGALMSEDFARWTSVDPEIVTVHWRTGLVTARAKGVGRVYARAGNARDTAAIWVAPTSGTAVPARVRITPSTYTLTSLGETVDLLGQLLDASGNPMAAGAIAWSTADPGIASVDQTGHVTALGNGTARVIASSEELADTARITVAVEEEHVVQSAGVVITPGRDTVAVGGTISLMAEVRDAQGNRLTQEYVHWQSLDAAADVSSTETAVLTGLTVTGRSPGIARIVATHKAYADTAVITVAGSSTASSTVRIAVDADTIPTVGGMIQLSASVLDASGNVVGTQGITWASLNPGIATVTSTGVVRGVARGVALVTASFRSTADTVLIWVEPGAGTGGGAPRTGTTIQSVIMGYSGTGTVLVSSGIPLPQGMLFPADTRKVAVYVNGVEQSLYVEALAGRHKDGSVRSILVQMRHVVAPGQSIPAEVVVGPAVNPIFHSSCRFFFWICHEPGPPTMTFK
jgi:uncharacterized protein YjdB